MKPDNAFMLELTANMPCKQINVNDRPYIQRMYAGTFINGNRELDLWFHRFLSCDGDEHLHWHSMNMTSAIICGSYFEEYLDRSLASPEYRFGMKAGRCHFASGMSRNYIINAVNAAKSGWPLRKPPKNSRLISMQDIHRIAEVEKDTWTMLFVQSEMLPMWGFIDENGKTQADNGGNRYWWKDYLSRGFYEDYVQ